MTIEEFIEARLGEWETAASDAVDGDERELREEGERAEWEWARFQLSRYNGRRIGHTFQPGAPTPTDMQRVCAALRLALEFWQGLTRLRTIAAIWSDHPDYREEWRS